MKKQILRIACALPLLAALACAETTQDRGKRVVNEALTALGGEKFLAMQDRVEFGRAYSFYREELSGLSFAKIYTRYLTPAPGEISLREREAFGKKEDSAVLFNEKEGYEITFRGARALPADQYERFRESTLRNVFYILHQRMKEPGLVFESRGTDVVDNQPVERVDITDSDNRVITVDFHRTTKLPTRQVTFRRDPKTNERIEEVSVFTKFRDVGGGVMWPFVMQRVRDGEKIFEIYSETVTINQGLTDNIFTLPSDTKILGGPKSTTSKK